MTRAILLLLLLSVVAGCGDDDGGPAENTAAACRDGADNDGDGATDCADSDCADFVFCVDAGTDGDADGAPDGDTDIDVDSDETDDGLVEADVAEDADGVGDEAPDVTADESSDEAGDVPGDVADFEAEADDGGTGCLPGEDGCGPTELCGDGLDNDCDGEVDEPDAGCTCTYGDVQPCFPGPPCGRHVGGCVDGWQACGRAGAWGPCTEALAAEDELPDGKDNDCDGETDEGLTATPTIRCPTSFESLPGRWWTLRCEDLCSPTAGGPCDCTWSILPPAGSGTLTVPDRLAETTRVYLDTSGNFIVTATILDPRLDTWRCSFALRAVPPGLEVDLWWDDPDPWRPGNMDLHVHRVPPRTPWFTTDDCHWGNCGGRDGTYLIDWGYADTPLADCPDLPPERSWWDFVPRRGCPNPRLPLESFIGPAGELFSLDVPNTGDGFRVVSHFYEDGESWGELPTPGYVRIVCAGRRVAQFGPVTLTSRDYGTGDLWRAADIEVLDVTGECAVTPLGTPDTPDVQGDFSRDYL